MTAHGVINLTFDIETWGGPNKPSLDDISAPANYKDPEKIQAYKEEKMKTAWADQAKDSLRGEIICLSYQWNDNKPISIIGEEKVIMDTFELALKGKLTDYTQVYWIGHNISNFDLPWILHRAWKYNLQVLINAIPTNPYDDHIVDTMNLFAGPGVRDPKNRRGLDDIAKFFGFEGKTEGMDGSMVHDAYVNGEIAKIAIYCNNDCEHTANISKILKPEIW